MYTCKSIYCVVWGKDDVNSKYGGRDDDGDHVDGVGGGGWQGGGLQGVVDERLVCKGLVCRNLIMIIRIVLMSSVSRAILAI